MGGGAAVHPAVEQRLGQPLGLPRHVAVGEVEGDVDGLGDEVQRPARVGLGDLPGGRDEDRPRLVERTAPRRDRSPQRSGPTSRRGRHLARRARASSIRSAQAVSPASKAAAAAATPRSARGRVDGQLGRALQGGGRDRVAPRATGLGADVSSASAAGASGPSAAAAPCQARRAASCRGSAATTAP